MKKTVHIDTRALKEIRRFPSLIQAKINAYLIILGRDGTLEKPFGKKISDQLFEIRVRQTGQWRSLYAYLGTSDIIILSAFQKKTQKTPKQEIEKAQQRLAEYKT